MNPTILTTEQDQAAGLAITNLRDLKRNMRLGGYAGTGKTTLIAQIVSRLESPMRKVLVMAPTGKAANVLCNKGVSATTIHRQLYELVNERPVEFRLRDLIEAAYFIIDESSMLSTELYEDIISFGKPTLFIGDPAQLEPVGNDAKLMVKPDFVLQKIHRTAEDSEIIRFATALRTSPVHPQVWANQCQLGSLPHQLNLSFRGMSTLTRKDWMTFDQIIVGKNITRHKFNQTFKRGPTPLPVLNDKIICLKNDYERGVFNGETFTVASDDFDEDPNTGEFTITLNTQDGSTIRVPFWRDYFFDQTLEPWKKSRDVVWLDFAYAITCHKAQGSEWDNVAVVDEAFGNPPNRWRYTAATRAAKQLTWIK